MPELSSQIDHVNIVVSDIGRSLAFYVGLLGMEQTFSGELTGEWIERVSGLPGVFAQCAFCQPPGGGTRLELLEYRTPSGTTFPQNALANTLGVRHFALQVNGIDAWYERLSGAGVVFISPPVTVPFPVGGSRKRLCYFTDPDGVLVELAAYEPLPEAGRIRGWETSERRTDHLD